LRGVDYISTSANLTWNKLHLISNSGEEAHLELSGLLSANAYQAILQLVDCGFGIASVPYYMVEARIQAGTLLRVLPEWSVCTHPLTLIYAKQSVTPRKVAVFVEHIYALANRHPSYFMKAHIPKRTPHA
ncbi:MAG: LysR substrate-binding domain-containing protein, partial [Myxococcota bacterium]